MSGARTFEAAGHRIEVRTKVHMRGGTGEAFGDGQLKASDLFSAFNDSLKPRDSLPRSIWREVVLWVLLVGILVFVFR
jgi:hypothetical protein